MKSVKCAVGSMRYPRLNKENVGFLSLRRSPRFNNEPIDKQLRETIVKGHEAETKENCFVSDYGSAGGREKERNEKRVGLETQDNLVISERGFGGGNESERDRERVEAETHDNHVVSDEGFDRGRKKETKKGRVEVETQEIRVVLCKGFGEGRKKGGNGEKRKRGGEEIGAGWTKEQELALERAYFSAKPTPHFWKNVSKLVPGKSQQECFDRIHCNFITPPQCQRRSRAKTLNSSPISQFSISASKLLKPTDKTVGKSNVLKPKNIINQKSVEKLLNLEGDLDHEGDIFSVLEPNIDFSTNTLQPSQALSTPKLQKENKGFLPNCTQTSSSSRKNPLSRSSCSRAIDLVSPPVLKKVKNRVMHEKYISQLRCRESWRRAASTKITSERNRIQKRDAVKAAIVALVSEARNAINKFQQSQANFIDNTCTFDEDDNNDDIEYEDESR